LELVVRQLLLHMLPSAAFLCMLVYVMMTLS
jgi:hypothetical protein